MKALLLATLLGMCTPGTPAPQPAPPVAVGGAGCDSARQFMVNLGCPPEEDAFGGWLNECSGWSNAGTVATCVQGKKTCEGTRACLEVAK